jgi:hypothetical protein
MLDIAGDGFDCSRFFIINGKIKKNLRNNFNFYCIILFIL